MKSNYHYFPHQQHVKGDKQMKMLVLLKSLLYFGFFITIGTNLSGCVSGKQKLMEAGHKPLTNQEFTTFFSEKRVAQYYVHEKGHSGTVTYLPDGSQSALSDNNGKTYTGTYYFEDNQYCSKMDFRKGEVRCTTWFKVADNKYQLFNNGGTKTVTLTFQ